MTLEDFVTLEDSPSKHGKKVYDADTGREKHFKMKRDTRLFDEQEYKRTHGLHGTGGHDVLDKVMEDVKNTIRSSNEQL